MEEASELSGSGVIRQGKRSAEMPCRASPMSCCGEFDNSPLFPDMTTCQRAGLFFLWERKKGRGFYVHTSISLSISLGLSLSLLLSNCWNWVRVELSRWVSLKRRIP